MVEWFLGLSMFTKVNLIVQFILFIGLVCYGVIAYKAYREAKESVKGSGKNVSFLEERRKKVRR